MKLTVNQVDRSTKSQILSRIESQATRNVRFTPFFQVLTQVEDRIFYEPVKILTGLKRMQDGTEYYPSRQ